MNKYFKPLNRSNNLSLKSNFSWERNTAKNVAAQIKFKRI